MSDINYLVPPLVVAHLLLQDNNCFFFGEGEIKFAGEPASCVGLNRLHSPSNLHVAAMLEEAFDHGLDLRCSLVLSQPLRQLSRQQTAPIPK